MISGPSSSFIPKQDRVSVPASARRRRTFSILHFIATIALLVSVMLAGGTYFYKHQQIKKQEALKVELQAQRDSLSEADILSVQNFDRKLIAAQFLLDHHMAPSKVFAVLEQKTLQRVQFDSFEYKYMPGDSTLVTLNGKTLEFSTLALQGRSLGESDLTAAIIAKTVGSAAEGSTNGGTDVIFSFEGPLDSDALRYSGSLAAPVTTAAPAATSEVVGGGMVDTQNFAEIDSLDTEGSNVSN